MAGTSEAMQGVCVVEKDTNGDVLVAWSFPKVGDEERRVAVARCGLEGEDAAAAQPYTFSRYASSWLYILTVPVKAEGSKVTAASVVVFSRVYNPAKYKALLALLARAYTAAGCSPLPLMKAYLSAFTTGSVKCEHGTFEEASYDDRRAFISPVKPLLEAFGPEVIVIWLAMLLKKRVFVVADSVGELLPAVRSFPLVGAWHRCDWSVVKPYVCVNDTELADLKGVYVAGFTDRRCQGLEHMYDLLVDLSARTLSIPEHAKASFNVQTSFHKQLARTFSEAAGQANDQQLIKLIATKTKELVDNLRSLRTEHDDGLYVTLEELQAQKMPPNMDRFLFNVAQAEKLTKSA